MKKRLVLILLSVLILFTSCDLTMQQGPKPKMYLIALGLGYEGAGGNALINTLNDSRGMIGQFRELCKAGGNEYEIVLYTDSLDISRVLPQNARRFTLTHYSDKQQEPDKPMIHLLDNGDIITTEDLEKSLFSQIDSMWNESPSEDDLILFYYTGHGIDSLEEYPLSPNAGGPVLLYQIYSNYFEYLTLNYDIIFRNMDKYPSRQLFIFDCCYSGASTDNKGEYLHRDDNELGYALGFNEAYEGAVRNDKYSNMKVGQVFTNAWEYTFNGTYGKPRRMVINASTYAQQSLNKDLWAPYEPGIENYGGFTYKLLKYLGYHFTGNPENDHPMPPKKLKGEVVTASSMLRYVYGNISNQLLTVSTPNMTRSSYDMVIWDFR